MMKAQTRSANVDHPDVAVSRTAAAIGEPARARMLYCLADGRTRTSTELGVVGRVSPSTASVHLNRLKAERLVNVFAQGKCPPRGRAAQCERAPRPVAQKHIRDRRVSG
jgi:DNA-binding transcriptional ArsR family regulator